MQAQSDQELTRTVQRLETLASRYDVPAMREGVRLLRGLALKMAQEGAGMDWVRMRPGNDPMGALERALGLRPSEDRRYLIVVDQFEEVFTHDHSPELREAFCRRLWQLAGGTTGVCIVCTIRVDFIGHCGQVVIDDEGLRLDQVAYDEAHRVFVAQMGKSSLRACIEEPARRVGLELEAGLAARLLEDVRSEPGALPVLSYTLDLLWQKRAGGRLTAQAYEALGGLAGALERKADEVYDSLRPDEQLQARRLLVRLVGSGEDGARDTRRQLPVERARPGNAAESVIFDKVLDILVDRRLLVRSDDGGHAAVEVAHEALIRKWKRLRQWVDTDREMLAELDEVERFVKPWQEYGTLLDGDQLGYARKVVERYPEDVSTEVRDLIHESGARRTRQERTKWALVAAVLLTVSGIGGWGWIQKGVAVEMQESALTAQKRTVDEVVRMTWKAAALLELPDDNYVRGVRDIAKHVSQVVGLAKIESISDMRVFVSGPHKGDLDFQGAEFGHYNPAFLDWALEHAIPAAGDERFRKSTQDFYERLLREPARIYLRIGRDVDLAARKEREVFQGLRPSHEIAYTYTCAVEDSFEDEAWVSHNLWYHAHVASGFWMRREADGTREQFLALTEKLVSTYDKDYFQAASGSGKGIVERVASELVGTWQGRSAPHAQVRFSADGTWQSSAGGSGRYAVTGVEGDGALTLDGAPAGLRFHSGHQGIAIDNTDKLPAGTYRKVNSP